MTSAPKNQMQQGVNRAKEILLKNNSAVSLAADQLFSLLEAGEDSFMLRDHLDTILHTYATTSGSTHYSWDSLRKCLGIKDKIAYIAGGLYAHRQGNNASLTNTLDDQELINELNIVISKLQEDLVTRENFTESWIIRHAAFNNFEMKLTVTEQASLSQLADKIRKVAADNGMDNLAEIMHFQKESDAQQIVKIKEALAICAEQGVNLDDKLVKQFEQMKEKIKPIEDLDKNYKHMMNMLNAVHRIGKKAYASMITPTQETKLLKVLDGLGLDYNTFIFDAKSQAENPKNLDQEFLTLKNKNIANLKKVLAENNMTQGELETYFFSYFGYKNVEKARADFDTQKITTFGTKIKSFETDVNTWRGMAREKILAVHGRMRLIATGDGVMDFADDDDYNFVNSYFEKFKDLFFADEKDSFGADGGHYLQMRTIIAALLRRRIPAICAGNGHRFGSGLRRVVTRMKNPTLTKSMKNWYERTDDAELLAMIIMAQNESTNMMFYEDQNPFLHKEKGLKRLAKNVSRTEHGREAVRDAISKPANTFLRLGEGALRMGAKATNKIISNTGRLATFTTGSVLERINKAIEGKGVREGGEWKFKWWKSPAYALWLGTRLAEHGTKAMNKGFNYTNANGNKLMHTMREEVVQLMQKGFNDNNINNVYQGFTYALDGVTSFLGKTISTGGRAEYNRRDTAQKRNVLGAFFEAASQEQDLSALMQSSDLATMLNLKESGPYIFDEDGRVSSVDKADAKKNDTPEGSAKMVADNLQKQIDMIITQVNKSYMDAKNEQTIAKKGNDEKSKIKSDVNFADAITMRSNATQVSSNLVKLVPLLKNPLNNNVWKHQEISAVTKILKTQLGNRHQPALGTTAASPAQGMIGHLETNIAQYSQTITSEQTNYNTAKASYSILEQGIKTARSNEYSKDQNIRAQAQTYLSTHGAAELAQQQSDMMQAEDKLEEAKQRKSNAEQAIAWMETVKQFVDEIEGLNNEMGNAITATAGALPLDSVVNSMMNLSKNFDLSISPEEKKEEGKNIIDLNNISASMASIKQDSIDELINALTELKRKQAA